MIIDNSYANAFILGGKSHCIIENTQTGNSFEYKIEKSKNSRDSLYFVNVRRGMWLYAGFIKKQNGVYVFNQGNKGILMPDSIEILALLYVLNRDGNLPPVVNIHHLGKCGRCGRVLTDEESIERGLGPECFKKVLEGLGYASIKP